MYKRYSRPRQGRIGTQQKDTAEKLIEVIYYEGRNRQMPLAMAKTGEVYVIKKVGGNPETKKFLESLGFVNGTFLKVVSFNQGNLIVNIKDSRIAIDRSMAMKIIV